MISKSRKSAMKIIYKTFQPTFPKKILFQEPAIGYFSPSLSYTLKTTSKKKKKEKKHYHHPISLSSSLVRILTSHYIVPSIVTHNPTSAPLNRWVAKKWNTTWPVAKTGWNNEASRVIARWGKARYLSAVGRRRRW